jgi:hypothetical protein
MHNSAYDYFPNQHQIFYRGRREGSMWYDPGNSKHLILAIQSGLSVEIDHILSSVRCLIKCSCAA